MVSIQVCGDDLNRIKPGTRVRFSLTALFFIYIQPLIRKQTYPPEINPRIKAGIHIDLFFLINPKINKIKQIKKITDEVNIVYEFCTIFYLYFLANSSDVFLLRAIFSEYPMFIFFFTKIDHKYGIINAITYTALIDTGLSFVLPIFK